MVHIPKVVGVLSCGFLMCLGLSHAAQTAADAASPADEMKPDQAQMKADQTDRRQGGQEAGEQQMSDAMKGGPSDPQRTSLTSKGRKTITGEMLRVEGENYFVKGQEGKEVRMQTDKNTLIMGNIRQGDRIEATVNEQDHAFLIRPFQ